MQEELIENVTYDEVKLGDKAEFSKTLSEEDIILFSKVSGDINPVHLDEEFASNTVFKGRIAHGLWSASLVSAALGTVYPGPGTIYLGQSLSFKRPVRINDKLEVVLEVKQKEDVSKAVILNCRVTNQRGEIVLTGEANVIAPTKKVSYNPYSDTNI